MATIVWNDTDELTDPLQKVTIKYGRPVKSIVNGSVVFMPSQSLSETLVGVQINENKPPVMIFDEDLDRKNRAHCHYLMGLGCLGLKRIQEARTHFQEALGVDPGHQKAALYLRNLENLNRLID